MGKLIRLQKEDYIDMTNKVMFDFVPKTVEFDKHLEAAERLKDDAAKHKADAIMNTAKAEKSERRAETLRRFTPHIVLGVGIAALAGSVNVFMRDALSLGLSGSDITKAIVLYAVLAIVISVFCAYIAHMFVTGGLNRVEKDSDNNRRLAIIHEDRAAYCEELAADHVKQAFDSYR
jgi:hypothetical protein